MIAALWLKAKGWAMGVCLLLGGLVVAWVMGREKGKQAGEADAQNAHNAAANANARAEQLEARHEVDAEVARLPEAPAQVVADARPDSAAGKLQVWLRD